MNAKVIKKQVIILLKKVMTTVANWCETLYQKCLQQQAQINTTAYYQRLDWIFSEIQNELVLVFHQAHYPNLTDVTSQMDFRLDSYKIQNGTVVFYYTIDKIAQNKLPSIVTNNICQNMNKDIFTFSRYLAANMPPDDAMNIYPALYWGTSIANIEDEQTFVRLVVKTNLR